MKLGFIYVAVIIFNLFACTSEQEKKQKMAVSMSKNICRNIGTELGSSIDEAGTGNESVDKFISSILNIANIPVEKFCSCFTDIIAQELESKFTYAELNEIRRDKAKQLMVAKKILETRNIQNDLESCLSITTQINGKEYNNFQKVLDDKFKE